MNDAASAADTARQQLIAALDRVAGADRAGLKEVYDLTSAKLFGICLRICGDREAAEDVLQDVYLKIWNRAGRFDASRASPITWMGTIARNAAIDWRRASKRHETAPESAAAGIADDRPGADRMMEATQERGRLHHCLDSLDDAKQRDAIRSAFFGGLTYAELAERMDVPLGTMKSWVRRGLMKLKACLADG